MAGWCLFQLREVDAASELRTNGSLNSGILLRKAFNSGDRWIPRRTRLSDHSHRSIFRSLEALVLLCVHSNNLFCSRSQIYPAAVPFSQLCYGDKSHQSMFQLAPTITVDMNNA